MFGSTLAKYSPFRKLITFRSIVLFSVALLGASTASAAPVTFSTSGVFTCGGCAGSGTNSVTFLGGQGNAFMLTFTGLGSTSLNTPTSASFGNFQTFVSGTGTIAASGTFTLTVTQTVPVAGSNSFSSTFTGTFSASNSGGGVVNFTVTSVTIGGIKYTITNNPLSLVPPASNNGITTVQGTVTAAGPTAAGVSVSGRVRTPDGRGLRNAVVHLTDQKGIMRTVVTTSLGYYRFDDVEAGATYIVGVSSRRYQFAPVPLTVKDQMTGVDFIAQ